MSLDCVRRLYGALILARRGDGPAEAERRETQSARTAPAVCGVSREANSVDFLEFVARSEWLLPTVVVIWLFHRPLKRMADEVIPKTIALWGAKIELEKRLSALEALQKEQREFLADPKVHAELASSAKKVVRDAWQLLETERRRISGALSEEDAQALKQLQEWKDEFLNHRKSFHYDEVLRFKGDAEQLRARISVRG